MKNGDWSITMDEISYLAHCFLLLDGESSIEIDDVKLIKSFLMTRGSGIMLTCYVEWWKMLHAANTDQQAMVVSSGVKSSYVYVVMVTATCLCQSVEKSFARDDWKTETILCTTVRLTCFYGQHATRLHSQVVHTIQLKMKWGWTGKICSNNVNKQAWKA